MHGFRIVAGYRLKRHATLSREKYVNKITYKLITKHLKQFRRQNGQNLKVSTTCFKSNSNTNILKDLVINNVLSDKLVHFKCLTLETVT